MLLIKAACVFHKGYKKTMQEDNFLFNEQILDNVENGMFVKTFKNPRNICFAVFDGLGGLPDGEKASKLAAETLKNLIKSREFLAGTDSLWMHSVILNINQTIMKMEIQQGYLAGTTMAGILIDNQKMYVGNVGDSRIYRFLEERLIQLSIDHSDRDLIEELGITDRKPSLMQYVGLLPEMGNVKPSSCSFEHKNTGRYIVCTDGLTDMVCDSDIETICRRSRTVEECSEKLMQQALDNGGADNITVIVCDLEEVSLISKITHFLKNNKGEQL